jgi:eukaryotic-like serine/threonine-protein kinase
MSSDSVAGGSPFPNDRHIGRLIKGTYVLEAKVGIGGFGAVYRARHEKLGSAVAVKFLFPHADDMARQRFEREARIAASISHPNVARVIDIDHDEEGSPFIVMEWVAGASLRALIGDRGSLGLKETVDLYQQFGSAMDAAHAKGVVHRDLKPENLLLTDEGGVVLLKVLDFGIARQKGASGTLTQGVAIGTPCYMAPESARVGSSTADHRVDIYAMGLLLYECLTGDKAIDGEPMDIFARQLTGNVVIPSALKSHPELPAEVDDVIAKACAREPDERYPSAGEMARALAAIPQPATSRPSVLKGLDELSVAAERSLTPSSLTPMPAAPVKAATPTPLPAAAPPDPAEQVLLPIEPVEPMKRGGLGGPAVVIAILLLGAGGAAWWATSKDDVIASPVKGADPAKAAPAATVKLKLIGVPPAARVYDAANPSVELAIQNGAVVLPRGTRPVVLKFEAAGYERIQFQVIPEEDQEINFGLKAGGH